MNQDTPDARLDALEAALHAERQALLGHDVDALVRANQDKLGALHALESAPPGNASQERVAALAELNRANGALLARRRREVGWALRHLGRSETSPAYDARGRIGHSATGRPLAAV